MGSGDPSIRVFRQGRKSSPRASARRPGRPVQAHRGHPPAGPGGVPRHLRGAHLPAGRHGGHPQPLRPAAGGLAGGGGAGRPGTRSGPRRNGTSFFCIGYIFVFLIKLQTHVSGAAEPCFRPRCSGSQGFGSAQQSRRAPALVCAGAWGVMTGPSQAGDRERSWRTPGQPAVPGGWTSRQPPRQPTLLRFVPSAPPCGLMWPRRERGGRAWVSARPALLPPRAPPRSPLLGPGAPPPALSGVWS